jgi:hydroxyacylglutathione hydrolase
MESDLVVVDVREPEAHAAVAVPGSIALPIALLSAYAGWFLPYDQPLCLVVEHERQERDAIEQLVRMGYARVEARLQGGVSAWETSGRALQTVSTVSVESLRERLDSGQSLTVVDVRKHAEFRAGHIPGAWHSYLGELPRDEELDTLPTPLVTFCDSGKRALVAASLLHRRGIHEVENCFGSMQAWQAIRGPIENSD